MAGWHERNQSDWQSWCSGTVGTQPRDAVRDCTACLTASLCLPRVHEIISRGRCAREWLTRDKDIALNLQCKSKATDSGFLRGSLLSQSDICLLWHVAGAVSHVHACPSKHYGEEFCTSIHFKEKQGQTQWGFNRYCLLYFHISSQTRKVSEAPLFQFL